MEEERIGLFIDYENLAIGARDDLGIEFDFKPITDALAERGRVVVRRAYADWTYFDEGRRNLVENHVEMIEISQRRGMVRKNAADIKMAVDAIELAFERDYVTTFVVCTGDSDFTPLVHKLRELNKRVIGVGMKASTSALLPAACDEFLFYERLEGVEIPRRKTQAKPKPKRNEGAEAREKAAPTASANGGGDLDQLAVTVTQTLAGLQRSSGSAVRSSMLKRALLRKDPTFSEADYGFRAFGELLRHLAERNVLRLIDDESSRGDPVLEFTEEGSLQTDAFALLAETVGELQGKDGPPALSGLKNEMRKRRSDFSEKRFGYSGFLQFVRAADTRGLVNLEWVSDIGDYRVTASS